MTQNAKPLTAEEMADIRRRLGVGRVLHATVCDVERLLATIDQQAAEIGRLKGGADWLPRLTAGYIKYGGENAPLAYFNDTGFPGELANILAEAREAHEAAKETK